MHAVEFSKTAAPRWRGFLRVFCASRSHRLPSGQWSLAHLSRGAIPRAGWRAFGSAAARKSSRAAPSHQGAATYCDAAGARNWRLPSCSTRPSSAAAGTSSGSAGSGSPSSFTPPWASLRRASEREPPKRSTITSGRCSVPPLAATTQLVDLLRQLVRDEDAVEAGLGLGRRLRAPEPLHERAREGALGVARADVGRDLVPEQQAVPGREQLVRDPQRLAVHLAGRLGDPDLVAERLRHLARAVEPVQQRHRQHDLRRLAVRGLQRAAHVQVERLVGAAELDVGRTATES